MPEGDAVYLTARRLDRGLKGKVLTASDFRWPSLATVDLTGATVLGTGTHGKHLLTRLEHDGTPLTLHTHLKMEGVWRVLDKGRRWPRPAHQARVVLRVEGTEAVGFSLGLVELFPTADEEGVIGHLGPDLMAEDFDEGEALRRLLERPDRPLGEALLDQTVVAGIGTIYLAETCFLQGAHPLAAVSAVRDPARLLRRAHLLLRNGVYYGRPTTAGERKGTVWVFRRTRQSCLRCGTPIEAGNVGEEGRERTTYWCPRCQPRDPVAT
ncbi:DNA glycosylase [Nocardioides silvaticus]|uniref:DNA-(apurinic or apyrimidinic site) lyase n=1 Tax=Nocardioides silvaticus TaxID=2201891 RepID=A0A316TEM9_9ACTN|nr:DNA-formamidopyrimidine glycosylase family protein [Nocardioides silvaticus]PWN02900.1 DNA glycosylase [Nocardioides silvaticus]